MHEKSASSADLREDHYAFLRCPNCRNDWDG